MNDIMNRYYENSKVPVFLRKDSNIVWRNKQALKFNDNRKFLQILEKIETSSNEEQTKTFFCNAHQYKIFVRPFDNYFYFEVFEEYENASTVLRHFYESLKTPVFFCAKNRIIWHNSFAASYFANKKFRNSITQLEMSTEEKKETFICDDFYYKVVIRPCEGFFYVEVIDSMSIVFNAKKELYKISNELVASEVMDNMARMSVHEMSQASNQISYILEKNNNFMGLKFVDIIVKKMYNFTRATNLLYEYNLLLQNQMNPEIVDVFVEIDALCSSVNSLIRNSGVNFYWEVPSEEIFCDIDMHKLSFALFHIICNSFRFACDGNYIKVVASINSKNYLQIEVCDKGPGIAEEIKDNILKPFFSFDRKSGDIAGVGLGLTYAGLFADKIGGNFKINSNSVGTKVFLEVPIVPLTDIMGLSSHIVNYGEGKYDNLVYTLIGNI